MLTFKKNMFTTASSQTSEIIVEKEIEGMKGPQLVEEDHIYAPKATNFTDSDYMSEFSCVLVVCKLYSYAPIIPLFVNIYVSFRIYKYISRFMY